MSQPGKTCKCAGKRCGNPCKPVMQPQKKSGGGCGGGASGYGGNRSGSSSCGSAGGCGCLGPFPQKTKPTK